MKIFSSPASAWLTFNENSKIQVGDSIPERLQSCFSRSLVEVAGKLNHGKGMKRSTGEFDGPGFLPSIL